MLGGASSAGCAPRRAPERDPLRDLERLAFVPAGQLTLKVGAEWLNYEVRDALLVEMYEVTREQWLRFQSARVSLPSPELESFAATWTSSTADWPASFMTHAEAEQFAAWRGMRLLTSGEWLYAAIGPQRSSYPWGATPQQSIANTLDLRLDRPAPVGTFEAGRTETWLYDMLGNVAEWTADLAVTRDRLPGDTRVSALGGSFRNHLRPILDPTTREGQEQLFTRTLETDSRVDDVGLRCGIEAELYLAAHASEWSVDESSRRRLLAIGRRWGRRALPLLERLATRAPAIAVLLEGARS